MKKNSSFSENKKSYRFDYFLFLFIFLFAGESQLQAQVGPDGVKELYPTAPGGTVWYLDMNNPYSDVKGQFNISFGTGSRLPYTTKTDPSGFKYFNTTGSKISYNSGSPDGRSTRLDVYPDGGKWADKTTYSWQSNPGYLYTQKGIGSGEFTTFIRVHGDLGTHQSYAHKINGRDEDDIRSLIEIVYPTATHSTVQVNYNYAHFPYVNGTPTLYNQSLTGKLVAEKWVGVKSIHLIAADRKSSHIEMWVDTDPFDANGKPKNNWILVATFEDYGTKDYNNIPCTWKGQKDVCRVDGFESVDFTLISDREILPKTPCTAATATISKVDAGCAALTGTATVSASGGSGSYTYLWSNGETSATASGLSPGTYSVTVNGSTGCSTSASVTINNVPAPSVNMTSTMVKCDGGADGSATANTSGGTNPYNYFWYTGDTTLKQLTPGTITASCDDGNVPANAFDGNSATRWSCNATGAWIMTDLGAVKNISYLDIAWYSGDQRKNNFVISFSNNGTSFTNVYSGTSSGTTANFENYSFKRSDGRYVKITVNGNNVNTWASINDIKITGSENGATPTVTGLKAGTYKVIVTDSSGCSVTKTITVAQPSAITVTTSSSPDDGSGNGTATASTSGGTPGYNYQWNSSPVQTSATATGLKAGVYTLTVTDANGCTTTATVTVSSKVTTGINDQQNKLHIVISPNPASDQFFVSTPMPLGTETEMVITDVTGRELRKLPVDRSATIQVVETNGLGNGVYLLRLKTGEEIVNARFIVIH